jgi:hypothetical protein
MVKSYQKKQVTEATEYWLREPYRTAAPSLSQRVLGRVGLVMISAGQKLVDRHTAVLHPAHEANQEASANLSI